jgi:hypothetical protein
MPVRVTVVVSSLLALSLLRHGARGAPDEKEDGEGTCNAFNAFSRRLCCGGVGCVRMHS